MPGPGDSYGTARELMRYLLRMEQGRLVDEFSSREIKRLIYVTERRIRYAVVAGARRRGGLLQVGLALRVREGARLRLRAVRGQRQELHELDRDHRVPGRRAEAATTWCTLVSNVLRKNSAAEHQALATRLQQLIVTRHGVK